MPWFLAVPRVLVIVLSSLHGVAGTGSWGSGSSLPTPATTARGPGLVVGLGVICLVFGLVSLTQAAMVCTGRGRLMATAAVVEADPQLFLWLWLWALPLEERLAHLLLVAAIVGLCALATSMWRRAA